MLTHVSAITVDRDSPKGCWEMKCEQHHLTAREREVETEGEERREGEIAFKRRRQGEIEYKRRRGGGQIVRRQHSIRNKETAGERFPLSHETITLPVSRAAPAGLRPEGRLV